MRRWAESFKADGVIAIMPGRYPCYGMDRLSLLAVALLSDVLGSLCPAAGSFRDRAGSDWRCQVDFYRFV